MCGIAGIFSFTDPFNPEIMTTTLRNMMDKMSKRGPDDQGMELSEDLRIGFGFQRLSILDLSPAGHQPMISPNKHSMLIMNGEIYNFKELRQELEKRGHDFISRTDSEILLHALEEWGIAAIPRLNGMFAFAWYDFEKQMLVLARDHAGIKPLYYSLAPGRKGIIFASQYNQLLLSPWGIPGRLREDVLHLYFRLHHIPPPYGLLENTYQLEPGHYLIIRSDGRMEDHTWWQLPRSPVADISGEKAIDIAGSMISKAVIRQMTSDVPLGVFLSGGVDSPLVTAIARQHVGSDLQAFTIGNPGWWQDESQDAKRYADALDVNFRLQTFSSEDMLATVQQAWEAQYEPFADYSILPTLLVSRYARQEITVALSGDGGDELFFGYQRPLSLLKNGDDFRYPWMIRYAFYAAGRLGFLPKRSEVIAAHSPADYYFNVNSRLQEKTISNIAPGLLNLPADFNLYQFDKYKGINDLANYSRYVEYYGQLQRGLKKMDMASMHIGLEVRVPLLDREVIETSLRIEPFTNLENGQRKQVLFKLLARYVPQEIIPQTKRGFAVPLGEWLRGPLKPIVEDMLVSGNLYPDGMFETKAVQAYWQEHLSGMKDHKWGLWTLLSLQGWAKTYL